MKKYILPLFLAAIFYGCGSKEPPGSSQSYPHANNSIQRNDFVLDLEIEQNAWNLAAPVGEFTPNKEKFLKRYFAVWNNKKPDTSFKNVFWGLHTYKNSTKKKYYGANRRVYSDEFFEKIQTNANTNSFGELSKPAITVSNALLRNIPTHEPLFDGFDKISQGYPFDELANSAISIGYPLYLSHFSKDGAFALVQNDVVWGWVDSRDIAILTEQEVTKFKKSNFITILSDNAAVQDISGRFLFYARVGSLLPFKRENSDFYIGEIKTISGKKEYRISKNYASIWPAKLTDQNIKTTIQSMLGEPYGWGGFSFYRDCSLFTKDILSTYGIWLPRNSKIQATSNETISLEGKTNEQKLQLIKQNGLPYATLLYMPGHIMLYVGLLNDEVMVAHSVWGLKTNDQRRALIAQSALTTLEIGKNRSDIPPESLLLSKITSMRQLASRNDFLTAKLSSYNLRAANNMVIFEDGTTLVFDDQKLKDEQDRLNNPDIKDMIEGDYPSLKPIQKPNGNVGRIRNEKFFGKIYGVNEREVLNNLKKLIWLPKHLNLPLKFNVKNGAYEALTRVSNQLDNLVSQKPQMLKFLQNPGGTYKWRNIANTSRLSPHSWGIAIDINVKFSHYWQWNGNEFHNEIPFEIVEIFEKNGFIWGGRWEKYDTMHFEYRPEFL